MISNDKLKTRLLKLAFNGDLLGIKEKKEDKIGYYQIPSNWEWKRIGDVVNIINGFTPLRTEKSFWDKPEINWFTIDDMRRQGFFINDTEQFITKKALGNSSNRLLPPNTTLLCCTASVGEVAFTNIPLTTNQQFNGLIVNQEWKDKITPYYIFEYAKTLKSILIDKAGKTTINFVSTKKLSDILIPIPPLSEQKVIVEKLENAFQLIDSKEKNDQEVTKLKESLKEKIINQYTSSTENDVSLEEISSIISKGTTPRGGNTSYKDDGVLFIRAENLGYGYNNLSNKKYVDFETHNGFLKRSILQENDILVSIAGALGRTSFVENNMVPCNCNQAVSFIRIKNDIEFVPKYICYCIMSRRIQDSLLSQVKKTAQPNLTLEHIKNIRIPFPTLEVQEKIVEKIESLFELIEQL